MEAFNGTRMAVGLVGAAGAILTGLHDYSYIPRTREPSHTIATRHAIGNAIVSTLFVSSSLHASKEDPQYQIKSDKTDHMAMHKGSALTKVRKTKT